MAVEHLDEENFEEALGGKTPIIIDFWAPWCGPCRMMAPVFEDLSGDYAGKLRFGKLNTDESPSPAQRSSIMSIPCLILFKSGKEAGRIVGAMPKEVLRSKIDALL